MQHVIELLKSDIEQLNNVIRDDLKSDILLINQISEYIISSGGKRIRPLLTLLCGRLCNYDDKRYGLLLHKMAAMIEYIHTATLLHDDVVDESGLRRGRKTANSVFGNAASVLVGDFIYTRAFQMMVQSNSISLLKIMADATNIISEGEVLQLLNIAKNNISTNDYFDVIRCKTAKLFDAATQVATIICNTPEDVKRSLSEYAICIGTAFQIADDVLDYSGNVDIMGKNIGDDLLEGKITLPLIFILNGEDQKAIDAIKEAIDNPHKANLRIIIDIVKNSGALNKSIDIAKEYANRAKNSINIFEKNQYSDALYDLANYTIWRLS